MNRPMNRLKQAGFVFALLLLASCGLSIPGLSFKKPLNGVVKVYDQDRKLARVLRYDHGKLDGLAVGYFPTGQVRWQVYYESGKKAGIQKIYYENGALKSQAPFVEGKLNGVIAKFDGQGRVEMEIPVKNNRISGQVLRYTYDTDKGLGQKPAKKKSGPSMPLIYPVKVDAPEEVDRYNDMVEEQLFTASIEAAETESLIGTSEVRNDDRYAEAGQGEVSDEYAVPPRSKYAYPEQTDRRSYAGSERPMRYDLSQDAYVPDDRVVDSRDYRDTRYRETPYPRGYERFPSYYDSYSYYYPGRVALPSREATPYPRDMTLPAETPRATSNAIRKGTATEQLISRAAISNDSRFDDDQALAREQLIRKVDKSQAKKGLPEADVVYRSRPDGNEYLVFPKNGSRDYEAWKYQLLRRGVDADQAVKKGI